jgi:hypothetical protein
MTRSQQDRAEIVAGIAVIGAVLVAAWAAANRAIQQKSSNVCPYSQGILRRVQCFFIAPSIVK